MDKAQMIRDEIKKNYLTYRIIEDRKLLEEVEDVFDWILEEFKYLNDIGRPTKYIGIIEEYNHDKQKFELVNKDTHHTHDLKYDIVTLYGTLRDYIETKEGFSANLDYNAGYFGVLMD